MTTVTAHGHSRIIPADAARAVGRFSPDGPHGYQASNDAGAPLRATREHAEADWLLQAEGAPKPGQPVRIVSRIGGEVRTGLAMITGGVRPHPDRPGWYVCWMKADASTIGTGGGAYVPAPGEDSDDYREPGILAVPVESARCKHCHLPIYADPFDTRGDITRGSVWRTGNSRGDCFTTDRTGTTWHAPDATHDTACCWLVNCDDHPHGRAA